MTLLSVSGVTTGYGATTVNRDVSLDLHDGEIVTVLGPNGAGKSTLLRTIAGLVKPRTGKVTFDGQDLTGAPPDVMARRGVVMVPEGRRIFADMSVEENLRLGAYTRTDGAAVEALRIEFGAAVLLVEQNAGLALSVASRGYLMQNGRIMLSGAIEELRDMSLMRDLYLGGIKETA